MAIERGTERLTVEGWHGPGIGIDLIIVVAYTLVAVVFVCFPVVSETIIRSALGLIMVLFMPGYALTAALYPGKTDIDAPGRVAMSLGLSIAVAPLLGLALNFTPWGIRPDAIVICLAIFTIICAVAANYRRHELKPEERFSVEFRKAFKDTAARLLPGDESRLDRMLTVILLLSIIASAAVLAYLLVVPKQGEKFTEFYILGPNGKAGNYPEWFHLGDEKTVIAGVINHEYRDVTYDLVVALNDSNNVTQLYSHRLTLASNQTWEQAIPVKPDRIGTSMDLEFFLYADGNMTAPYRDLRLWISVTKPVE